ncbi:MAG TPA: hypothetical protein VNV37_08450 [Solirubrobacteraceae bacterium]|jgi:hypothetical protein|nr:hypothetical protein [Solirubrobacteraceae bacterium]
MARVLVLGGGARGLELVGWMRAQGHAARVVTRSREHRASIERVGAECWIGDPQRLGTLRGALEGVTVACWLFGTVSGPLEQVRELHGDRLRAFLRSAIDTTVRGVLYEAAGTVEPATLAEGARIAAETTAANAIPLAFIRADPADRGAWLEETRMAVDALLGRMSTGGPVPSGTHAGPRGCGKGRRAESR